MTSQSIIGPQAATEAPVDEKESNLEKRGPSTATVLGVDNEETMTWLEQSLKRVRRQKQVKLTGLLEAVQAEVAFELRCSRRGAYRV